MPRRCPSNSRALHDFAWEAGSMATNGGAALGRIWAHVLRNPRQALEETLPPTDLQTLLLAVARARAEPLTPADLVRRWREDDYVRPSTCDPRVVARVEAHLWDLLPECFAGVELSPVVPLGTSSALATVDQNRVLSTVRSLEVVSDLTNALAIEAARRRRDSDAPAVHLAGCHRVLRLQRFPAPHSQHFRLFALVSTMRDGGSGRSEASLLSDHLSFWITSLRQIAPHVDLHVELSSFDSALLRERLDDTVVPALEPLPPRVTVLADVPREHGRGYYTSAALRIVGVTPDGRVELGDGGLTTWTAQLMADAKERCLISCVSTERLAKMSIGE
jgi:hypothetical protein